MSEWDPQPESTSLRALLIAGKDAEQAMAGRMRLHTSEFAAMGHVTTPGAVLGPSELSGRLGLTPAAVTDLVDRLEQAGHLRRERDTIDRRRVRLVATEHARDEVMDQLRPLVEDLDALATTFDDTERDAIRRYLAGAIEAYRRFAESR